MVSNPTPPAPQPSHINHRGSQHKALVLGGGSLKGAFQTGAILAILEAGFEPDAIYGISVGSLNASFLAHEATRQHEETGKIDWPTVGRALLEFWIRNITGPQAIAEERSRFRMGYDTLFSRFDGLMDNAPLRTLLTKTLDTERLKRSVVALKVGAVDIIEGDMVYANPSDEHFLDYVIASSSLPFLMPATQIGGDHRRAFLDGGLREVAPLRIAIEDGVTEIMCIACHARKIFTEKFNYRNLFNLIDRVKDITVNQLVNNDIAWAERFAEREKLHNRDFILKVVRPHEPLHLDLQQFTSEDIGRLMVLGYQTATDSLRTWTQETHIKT